MSDNKMQTIKLQGKDYAPVKERVKAFHNDNTNGSIETNWFTAFEGEKNSMISFKATVIPDVKNPDSKFTGHALGKIASEKGFEKLETIAVGRALANAGYLADGDIASADEMERFYGQEEQQITYPKEVLHLIGRYPFDSRLKTPRNSHKPWLNEGGAEFDKVEKDVREGIIQPQYLSAFYTMEKRTLDYFLAIPDEMLEIDSKQIE